MDTTIARGESAFSFNLASGQASQVIKIDYQAVSVSTYSSMTVIPFLLFIFFTAGFIQGLTGFGSALVAIPLLTIFFDIKTAIPLTLLNGFIIITFLFVRLQSHINRKRVTSLCISSIPGLIIGVILLKTAPSKEISVALGLLIIVYSLYCLLFKPTRKKLKKRWTYIAGFSTGLTAGAFSAGGPPVIIYSTLSDWDKNEIKGTLTTFFLFNSLLIIPMYCLGGLITWPIVKYWLYSGPAVLLGTLLGLLCSNRLSTRQYLDMVYILLGLFGTMMVIIPWFLTG